MNLNLLFISSILGYPVSVSGVITLPVHGGMYQTMVANIQQIHTGSDGAVCVTPVVQVPPKFHYVLRNTVAKCT